MRNHIASVVRFFFLLTFIVSVSLGALAQSQANSGIIEGHIADPNGAVVAGATVTATNEQIYEDTAIFDPSAQMYITRCVDLGPSSESVFVVLYGSGIRGIPLPSLITALIGGASIPVLAALSQGTYVGLDQINLGPIPRSLIGHGIVRIRLVVDGIPMNDVEVCIK